MKIKFLRPEFPPIYSYILDLIKIHRNNQFSNNGEYVQKFENKLKEYLNSENKPVCVANATFGLTLALRSLGLKDGAIVYTTSFTFPATIQVIKDLGYKPIYVDINEAYMTMCAKDLDKKIKKFGTENAAIMPVCSYGGCIDSNVIRLYGLPTVVDAAGAIGTYYSNYADAVVYSFHATKCLPVGEGGCVVFKDKEKEKWARRAIDFGFDTKREVIQWGLNGKMTEYEAAIGIQSLKKLYGILDKRQELRYEYSRKIYEKLNGRAYVCGNGGLQLLTVICDTPELKDVFKYHLNSHGIETREYYNPPCHLQEFLAEKSAEVPVTEDLCNRILSLPLYSSLTWRELWYIKKVIDNWEYVK